MVVLSVAICTKAGKALLSRQFVDTSRMRLEGLLAAFPKLIAGEGSAGKQHTFVETESVRYVYLPLESLYLVLVTNKGSNIMEDLDTLRLLSKLVPEQLGSGVAPSEESITSRAFELIFAIDECITAGGHREDVTLHAIRTNLEMESHEEKLAGMIKASRMAEAKETAKRKAAELKEKEREMKRSGVGSPPGISGGYTGGPGGYDDRHTGSSGSSASRETPSYMRDSDSTAAATTRSSAPAAGGKAGGMKLGSKKGPGGGGGTGAHSSSLAGLMAEEGIRDRELLQSDAGSASTGSVGGSAAAAVSAAAAAAAAAVADQAVITIKEDIAVSLTRDGGCDSMEVKGLLSLTVADAASSKLKVTLRRGEGASAFTFQTHPQVNKALFTTDAVIALKSEDRGFPVGTALGVLRWRSFVKDTDASSVPLTVTCWPEEAAPGVINVNLEYNLQASELGLHDVVVTIPLGGDAVPKVASCDGVWKHNTRENVITWHIDAVNADAPSGSMEFNVKGRSVDTFFPVRVTFSCGDTLCPCDVVDVTAVEDGRPLRCGITKSLAVENYSVA